MNAGRLETSPRLQATLAALTCGAWRSTLDIHGDTGSMAVHSDIAGLRANGVAVETQRTRGPDGTMRAYYRLAVPAPAPAVPLPADPPDPDPADAEPERPRDTLCPSCLGTGAGPMGPYSPRPPVCLDCYGTGRVTAEDAQ